MKDTYTIIYENLDDDNNYIIKINTPIGVFAGKTRPDKEDSLCPSAYHASEIALAKALEKYAKATISILQREINMLKNIIKQIDDNKKTKESYSNTAFCTIWGTLKQKEKELQKWNSQKANIAKSLQMRIAARERVVAAYQKKDEVE